MSIVKDKNFRNKYILQVDSTNGDFQEIIKNNHVKCIICNRETAKCFRPGLFSFGQPCITINNNVPTGIFWLNGIY